MGTRINGELFTVANSPRQRDLTEVHYEVEGSAAAELRLTELDQVEPAGYYRIRVQGDKLLFQRAAKTVLGAENWRDWVDADTLLEMSKTGAIFKVPIDLSSLAGFTGTIIDTVPLETPDVVWLGQGYGPSEEPVGYLVVAVNSDEEQVYIPFWRGQSH